MAPNRSPVFDDFLRVSSMPFGLKSLILEISFAEKNCKKSTILFVAVGCGVIPIVPRLQVSSSLDISIARTATSTMSKLTSKHHPTFPTSLSRHILAVTVPVRGLWEHFHTPLSVVRALCFPLCRAWNPLSFHCCLTTHDVRKWVSFETHLRGY